MWKACFFETSRIILGDWSMMLWHSMSFLVEFKILQWYIFWLGTISGKILGILYSLMIEVLKVLLTDALRSRTSYLEN